MVAFLIPKTENESTAGAVQEKRVVLRSGMEEEEEDDDADQDSVLKASMQMITDYCSSNPGEGATDARDIGRQLGVSLAGRLPVLPTSLNVAIDALSTHWVRHGMGEIRWENRQRRRLSVKHASERLTVRVDDGRTFCHFIEGLLQAVVQERTGRKFEVKEVRCGLTRTRPCIFKIRRPPRDEQQ